MPLTDVYYLESGNMTSHMYLHIGQETQDIVHDLT